MPTSRPAFGSSVILGGGAVGSLLADGLTRCSEVVQMYDRQPRDGVQTGDALSPGRTLAEALSKADLVILALPENVLQEALPVVLRHAAAGALVVETGAAKVRVQSLAATLPHGAELLGINPLFAPTLGFAGQNVAVVKYSEGAKAAPFESCMRSWGAKTVSLSAQAHDQSMAIVQVAVHAAVLSFGGMLANAPVDVQTLLAVATPPFRVLLLMLGRILGQAPEVYWDIQSFNAAAVEARDKLAAELSRCHRLAADPNGLQGFEDWLGQMKASLGPLYSALDEGARQLMSYASGIRIQAPDATARHAGDTG